MKVYIGFDSREPLAYEVAAGTLRETSGIEAVPLEEERLRAAGMLWRPVDRRGSSLYDLHSGAPWATEFAVSRFLVPLLAQRGLALFTDCDMVFMADVRRMQSALAHQPGKAVYVVKHHHEPGREWKMVNQPQTRYARKNWSSVVLFNCDHPAHLRLNLHLINNMPGRWLHAFGWLHDDEIGELDPAWNWLVNEQSKPERVSIAHFTNGGPFTPEWHGAEHDDLWLAAAKRLGLVQEITV